MLTFTFLFTGLVQFVLALFVYTKSNKSLTHVIFSMIAISEIGWIMANFLTIQSNSFFGIILPLRLILFFVVMQNTLFYLFARVFPDRSWKGSTRRLKSYLIVSALVAGLTLSPFVFASAEVSNGIASSSPGPAILVFILHAFLSILFAFRILLAKRRDSKGYLRNQLNLLLLASAVTWIFVPITNFAITQFYETQIFVKISPIYTFIFAAIIAYTIVSQKLFDIKAIATRAVAYISALVLIVLLYSRLLNLATGSFLYNPNLSLPQRVVGIVLAIFVAILFKPIKVVFDKVTNRIFYRDSYDSQTILDNLNNILVNNQDLDSLLDKTSLMIQESMKISNCTIYARDTAYFPVRVYGNDKDSSMHIDIEKLNDLTKDQNKVVIDIENEDNIKNSNKKLNELAKIMSKHDYDVVARVVDSPNQKTAGFGYILLGHKSTGTTYSSQDIKLLTIIASELVIAIENALRLEEIEQFNVSLQKKIDGATEELKQSNKKLVALDEAKDEFVTMASHQLRTPLTSIKGYISMVLDGDAGAVSDQQKTMLGQAFFSAQRMVYLISDLLNVSRLKTGKFIVEAKPLNLASVIETEVAQLSEGFAAKNIKLTVKTPKNLAPFIADEMKIRQVIMNFLDNAIYYTPKDGEITITLEEDKEIAKVEVIDTGIGVADAEQKKLFTKFYRAENARKARPDGTGLGLFMAKKVIEAHNGEVIFKSKLGEGSTFGFKIPLGLKSKDSKS